MRIEYIIIGFILLLVVFAVAIGMLTGVIPGFENAINILKGIK